MLYLKLDVLIFSALVLIVTYLNFSRYQKKTTGYVLCIKIITFTVITLLLLDVVINVLFANLLNSTFTMLTKILLSISYTLTTCTSWIWVLFLIFYLRPIDPNSKKYAILTSIPSLINLSLVLFNFIKPIYFDVTVESGYQRLPLFTVYTICNFIHMFFAAVVILKEIKNISLFKLWVLLSFEILPFIGGIFQTMFFGIFAFYPAEALALVLIYVYLKEDISILDSVSKAYSNKYLSLAFNNIIKLNKADYSLCYIDIDNLGKINKEFGEKEGDYLLQKFAEIANDCLTAPDFIANSGGDEFIIYYNNNNEEQILNNLKILNRNVEYFNRTSNKPYNIKFTFVYYINNSNKISPYRIFKTLCYKLAIKKEKLLNSKHDKPYINENYKVVS